MVERFRQIKGHGIWFGTILIRVRPADFPKVNRKGIFYSPLI